MPRIKAANLEEHHERVWADVTAALRELLVERDFPSITLAQIAERAGLARNTLYNYAGDKAVLSIAVAERASRPVIERIGGIVGSETSASIRIRGIVAELLRAFDDPVIRLMIEPALGPSIPAGLLQGTEGPLLAVSAAFRAVIQEGSAAGEFRSFKDPDAASWLLMGIIRAASERAVQQKSAPADLVPLVEDLVLAALAASA